MTEDLTADQARYYLHLKRMQSGVAAMMPIDPKSTEPKHLRVGVNSALVDTGAIAKLLLAKGVFTREELWKQLADSAEEEADKHEKLVQKHLGAAVKLGPAGG